VVSVGVVSVGVVSVGVVSVGVVSVGGIVDESLGELGVKGVAVPPAEDLDESPMPTRCPARSANEIVPSKLAAATLTVTTTAITGPHRPNRFHLFSDDPWPSVINFPHTPCSPC
jgi:hypothetical protein